MGVIKYLIYCIKWIVKRIRINIKNSIFPELWEIVKDCVKEYWIAWLGYIAIAGLIFGLFCLLTLIGAERV